MNMLIVSEKIKNVKTIVERFNSGKSIQEEISEQIRKLMQKDQCHGGQTTWRPKSKTNKISKLTQRRLNF
jgi:hypothetical protein